jgi:hypothetical protein
LKPDEIGDLHLVMPRNASGEAKLLMQLASEKVQFIENNISLIGSGRNRRSSRLSLRIYPAVIGLIPPRTLTHGAQPVQSGVTKPVNISAKVSQHFEIGGTSPVPMEAKEPNLRASRHSQPPGAS